ncbi:MAG: damage-control phosphatase ARMT1 family protein [Wolinella sp.]
MKAKSECLLCLLKQAHVMAKIAQCDEVQTRRIILEVAKILGNLGECSNAEPPLLTIGIYAKIGEILGDPDPYKALKAQSLELARRIIAELEASTKREQYEESGVMHGIAAQGIAAEITIQGIASDSSLCTVLSHATHGNRGVMHDRQIPRGEAVEIKEGENPPSPCDVLAYSRADSALREELAWALRIAVLGNMIDYGAQKSFSLEEEKDKIFDTPFARDDFEAFFVALLCARKIVYLGDNIFDKVLLRSIHRANREAVVYYFTRGGVIINDLTFGEARESEMEELCTLVNSGVPSPGFICNLANKEARELYDEADLVLLKGMGNFETLKDSRYSRPFMLFKVKCDVVAQHLGFPLGSFTFMRALAA